MLSDPQLMKAVSAIRQRAERQQELEKILGTFVDVGVLPQLSNKNHQIVYGRRGTGKTHVFQVLGAELKQTPNNAVLVVDARTLGSSAQFSDPSAPVAQRCLALFRDLMGEVYNALLDQIVRNSGENTERSLALLDQFAKATLEVPREAMEVSRSEKQLDERTKTTAAGAAISPTSIGGKLEASSSIGAKTETTSTFTIKHDDKVLFPAVHGTLKDLLDSLGGDFFFLIDEWSSIPVDLQPYLAEFLKRSFLPLNRAVLKIAALEYRTQFGIRRGADVFGFEVGADIATALDIDDYFVYDRNPRAVSDAFGEMLYKHLASDLPEDSLASNYRISSGKELQSRLFTSSKTFEELVRASEGVARDLINIFTTAYFDSQRKGRDSIEQKSILEAARQWFEKDKAQSLDAELEAVLRRIIEEVIGKRRSRSFLLPRELEHHRAIQRLFDARVLHHIQRGYADKDNPGVRYNIYTLDYGTYVDLLNTSKEPEMEMPNREVSPDFVVPFDDKRSIRRIILTEDVLTPR